MKSLFITLCALCAAFTPLIAASAPDFAVLGPYCQKTDWNQDGELNRYVSVEKSIETGAAVGARLCGCDPLAWGQVAVYHALAHGFPSDDWVPPDIINKKDPRGTNGRTDITAAVGGATVMLGDGKIWWDEPRSTMPGTYNWQDVADKTYFKNAEGLVTDSPVGRLMWNLGILGHTLYKPGASMGAITLTAFNAYFGFKGQGYRYSLYFNRPDLDPGARETLRLALRCSLAAEAPVSTSITGHQVVIDGYGVDAAGSERFHVDYGWGNSQNQWHTVDELVDSLALRVVNVNVHPEDLGGIVTGRIAYADLSGAEDYAAVLTSADGAETRDAKTGPNGVYVIAGLPENSAWTLTLSAPDGTVLKTVPVTVADFFDDDAQRAAGDGKGESSGAVKDKGDYVPLRYAGAIVDLTLEAYPPRTLWFSPDGTGDGVSYERAAVFEPKAVSLSNVRICLAAGDYTLKEPLVFGQNCTVEGGYTGDGLRDPWRTPTVIRIGNASSAPDITAGAGTLVDGVRFISTAGGDGALVSGAGSGATRFDGCLFRDEANSAKKTIRDAFFRRCVIASPNTRMATGETAVLHCAFAGDVSWQAGTPCVNYGGNVGNIGADPAAWGPSADTCAHAGDHDCPALGLDGAPLNGRRGPFAATPVRTLSINFVGGKNASDEAYCVPDDPWQNYGLVSVPGSIWNNVRAVPAWSNGYTCSAVPVVSDGSKAALTFSANTVWVEPEMRDVFMKGFLDDTGGHPVFITVTDVPFASYDLWLYTSTDQNAQFRPFTVNGVAYTAGEDNGAAVVAVGKETVYGSAAERATVLNRNVLRIEGLSGSTLTIQGEERDTNKNCGTVSAIQIIERAPSFRPGYRLRLR